MNHAVVTGATGCVGRNLVEQLALEGWRITVLHRGRNLERLDGVACELVECDLHSRTSTLEAMPKDPTCVFHCAANCSHWFRDRKRQLRDNVAATKNLLFANYCRGGRFIYVSTGATRLYEGVSPFDVPQQYVASKMLAERLCDEARKQRGQDVVIIQPGIVMGKYDYNNYSQLFTETAKGRRLIPPPGAIEFTDATALAVAMINAYWWGVNGERYVVGGCRHTWLEVYGRIAHLCGATKVPCRAAPLWILRAISYPALWASLFTNKAPMITPQLVSLLACNGETPQEEARKTMKSLAYRKKSIGHILKKSFHWLKEEGMI